MYKVIVDANVWIKYARSKNIAPLLDRFVAYNILPISNNYLLSEIFDALVANEWMNENQSTKLVAFVKKICFNTTEKAVFALSPDPKDNYLFDLAVQFNCAFIISDDHELLQFKLKPIPVITSTRFIKSFEV